MASATVAIPTPTSDGDERFFALSLDLLTVVGFDGLIKRLNPAWERTLGWTPDEMVGRPYADFLHPDDRERSLAEAARLIDPDARTFGFELRVSVKSGGWRWLLISARGVLEEEAIYAVGKDITDRKAAEEALAETTAELRLRARELERSNAELEQFAYVASHDLTEPLRMIAGFVQLLADRYRGRLDSDADEFIGYTVDGVERMQALINGLLAYSRVGRSVEHAPVDLRGVVDDALAVLRPVVEERAAHVEVGELPTVRGDRRELAQLFQNLLSNALKFVPDRPPRVDVSARREDATWAVSVRDNGIGIEPRHAERVFKMFQRLHARDEYTGTGIGLAICEKIVERHGGEIRVEPADGGGSVFTVTLPAAEDEA